MHDEGNGKDGLPDGKPEGETEGAERRRPTVREDRHDAENTEADDGKANAGAGPGCGHSGEAFETGHR
ncbi:hypothetical protein D3C72_2133760 [compost metagenome]